MSEIVTVAVPDLGDFAEVPVIEVLVASGDTVAVESPLIALESDKATMEVPSPRAGVVIELLVAVGQSVSAGTPILTLEVAAEAASPPGQTPPRTGDAAAPAATSTAAPSLPEADRTTDLLVIGGGPGGYTAAFRAADLGVQTLLVERDPVLGGVCLNVGCIPSKALLHVAAVIAEAADGAEHGVRFGTPEIDLDALRTWKDSVVSRLTGGLAGLAKARKVAVVQGEARFDGPNRVTVSGPGGTQTIAFARCIVAVGSRPIQLPGLPEDERIVDSTGALALADIPTRLLVVGGGIIGLEMATVYDALGSRVTIVELADQLIPGCDPDLVAPLRERISARYEAIHLGVRVAKVEATKAGLKVSFEGEGAPAPSVYDRVLVAVGRRSNGDIINAAAAGLEVDERGFIAVDRRMATNLAHVHAIGDVVGHPMLAHKATHEAKVAAEAVAGDASAAFDPATIPSVAYTDPEVAWAGLTETRAAADGIAYEVARFPWAASGRALSLGRPEGLTKVLVDPASRRVLGVGIVGKGAGELIAEAVLAIEMGADVADVALTIHPHPTLSESIGLAAEVAEGTVTDLPPPRRR